MQQVSTHGLRVLRLHVQTAWLQAGLVQDWVCTQACVISQEVALGMGCLMAQLEGTRVAQSCGQALLCN